jgi:hypothetical protein
MLRSVETCWVKNTFRSSERNGMFGRMSQLRTKQKTASIAFEKRRPCLQCAYVGHPKIAITSPFGTRRTRRRFTRYCRITHNLNNYNGICRKGRLRPSDRLNSRCSLPSPMVAGIQFIRPRYTLYLIFTFSPNIHVCIHWCKGGS